MARIVLVAALLVGTASLVGCSGDKDSREPSTAATGTTAAKPPLRSAGQPTTVASGIPFPTNVAFDRHGELWVTSGTVGLNPKDGVWYAPRGGRPRQVLKGLYSTFGLVWVGDRLYVAHVASPGRGRVTMYENFDGKRFARSRAVLDSVTVGRLPIAQVVRGPDGRLYVGVGSPADNADPPGRVLSFRPTGLGRAVVEATGLRSAFGLAFYGSRLLVTDAGRDDLGPSEPPDELNMFDPSGPVPDFGYPLCYGQSRSACAGTEPPFVEFPAHSSPGGVAVKGDVAFVAEGGSAHPANDRGASVTRIDLRTGKSTRFWKAPVKYDAVGLAIGPDGDLYLTAYVSGKVLRFGL